MHALMLAVNLAAAASGAAPELHLAPSVALAQWRDDGAPASDPAPPADAAVGLASAPRELRAGEWLAASGLVLAGDAVLLAGFAAGFAGALSFDGRQSSSAAGALLATAVVGYVFLPPALAIWGARLAGAPSEFGGRAYLFGFLVRAAAVGATSLAARSSPELATAVWLGSELVLMPYVVASTLASAPPPGAESPLALALPVRDPALLR